MTRAWWWLATRPPAALSVDPIPPASGRPRRAQRVRPAWETTVSSAAGYPIQNVRTPSLYSPGAAPTQTHTKSGSIFSSLLSFSRIADSELDSPNTFASRLVLFPFI